MDLVFYLENIYKLKVKQLEFMYRVFTIPKKMRIKKAAQQEQPLNPGIKQISQKIHRSGEPWSFHKNGFATGVH